ncbi:MAG: hypothetical protein ACRC6A_00135 [Fusobacteriaceae bacterium]
MEITSKFYLLLYRNAYNGIMLNQTLNIKKHNDKKIRLCYIGTVSSWFDVDVLKYVLEKNNEVEIHIIGPIDINLDILKKNEKVKIYGSIKHEKLSKYVQEMDILIMNFKVNDIILSVDPVKIYEYINFNKPIICVEYQEVKRFNEYVNFYKTEQDFYENILEIKNEKFKPKYSLEKRKEFLMENTWRNRVKDILNKIEDEK